MKKWIFTMLLTPALAFAEIPSWQIVPAESSITFTATQNNAPVTGEFKTFSADIKADPQHLDQSSVKIIIDITSVSDAYNQLSDTLKDKDWFNTQHFPQAIFTSTKFTKTGDKTYTATGTLTIRDKKVPITLNFTQEEYTQNKGVIKGSTTIKRIAFGVGQGEWADTKVIKDDVLVNFKITATKK